MVTIFLNCRNGKKWVFQNHIHLNKKTSFKINHNLKLYQNSFLINLNLKIYSFLNFSSRNALEFRKKRITLWKTKCLGVFTLNDRQFFLPYKHKQKLCFRHKIIFIYFVNLRSWLTRPFIVWNAVFSKRKPREKVLKR